VTSECDLLRARGLDVIHYQVTNEVSAGNKTAVALRTGLAAPWSSKSYHLVRELTERLRPDVAHVHNFWLRLSPSVHAACRASGCVTVQTLHNFRLLCTNGLFLRDGKPCEDCLGCAPWRAVVGRCYRDSFLASGAAATMIQLNRWRGTWHEDVDAFVALTHFARKKFLAGGLPDDKLFVKPNFADQPRCATSAPSGSKVVLYAGRFSAEKGIGTLLTAWARAGLSKLGSLMLAGGDQECLPADVLDLRPLNISGITFAGRNSSTKVLNAMANARIVVIPSICYENFPRSLVEAFSLGRPVVVSDLGGLREIVTHGWDGLKVAPGDEVALGCALRRVLEDDSLADTLGANARTTYLTRYTPDANYEMLMGIYRSAFDNAGRPLPHSLRSFAPAENHRGKQDPCLTQSKS